MKAAQAGNAVTGENIGSMSGRKKETGAYGKDIFRSIQRGKKRFLSIMVITVLGTMMFSGLKAACTDLRVSADRFCDAQNVHDLCIVSTLGLTQDDVDVLQGLDGVEKAEGAYSEDVDTRIGDVSLQVTMQTLSGCGIDRPYIEEGRLPKNAEEAVVTDKFIQDTGAKIGDRIVITETDADDQQDSDDAETADADGSSGTFYASTYVITGVAIDPTDLNNPFGSVSYRTSSADKNRVFVLKDAADSEYYTAVYIILDGTRDMYCFSNEYEDTVDGFVTFLEAEIKEQREQARTEGIRDDAAEKIDEAEKEVNEELADALRKLENAEQEFADAREEGEQKLADGEKELRDRIAEARQELRDAQTEAELELDSAREKLEDAQKELDESEGKLSAGEQELKQQEEDAKEQLAQAQAQIDDGYRQLADAQAQLDEQETALAEGEEQIAQARTEIDQQEKETLDSIASQRQALQEELKGLEADKESGGESGEEKTGAADGEKTGSEGEESVPDADRTQPDDDSKESSQASEENDSENENSSDKDRRISEIQVSLDALDEQEQTASKNFEQARTQIDQQEQEQRLKEAREQLDAARASYEESLPAATAQLEEAQRELDEKSPEAESEIDSAKQQLENGREELNAGKEKLQKAWDQYYAGEKEARERLAEAEQEIDDGETEGEQELADGREELEERLAEGRKELDDSWDQYYDGAEEANQKFADARAEIEDIDMAVWYIQDRMSMSGYANIDSDAGSIEAIGTVFPVVFFIVAILISLTTITRMVEEDRGLIGTYKSLGFTDREILRKYMIYAGLACAAGSAIGTALAFIALPSFIFTIFHVMYLLPDYVLTFVPSYGFLGAALFLGGVLLATCIACRSELKQMPAALMRPKAPRAGSRVLLESVRPLWKKLSFLNKVTARNLFRYKKRMLMTIFGIAGCMALLLFGFAIRDSVTDLMPRQYEQTFLYDIMDVASSGDDGKLTDYLNVEKDKDAAYIDSSLAAMITSVTLEKESGSKGSGENPGESVTLIAVSDGKELEQYINLRDTDGNSLELEDGQIYISQNAGNVMGFGDGDSVSMQLPDLQKADIPVTHLVQNYLGNYLYMTQKTYEQYFNGYEENGVLINLSEECPDPVAYAEKLGEQEGILSSLSIQKMKDQFSGAFRLINMVVYVIIVMSAALAFVVLFTLATTNIMERERELATIKVLGFYDREVHLYVDKETMILTGIGILLGVPLGRVFAQTLTAILNLPSIYLAVSLHGKSYLLAAGLTLVFAITVNLFTDRTLDGIDPVEALKSVE